MTTYVFPPAPQPSLPTRDSALRYPVRRIFCVGRNYAAHAAEMGNEVDREAPFYFTKSPDALAQSGAVLPYPPGTKDLHHEVELVVAMGAEGSDIPRDTALEWVWGYGTGLDLTRRDLQQAAKDTRRPWDTGKDFEGSAVIGCLAPAADADLATARIVLDVNGVRRQDAPLADMVWDVAALIAHLSTLYRLRPGDLIMTGTPAGVSAVGPGDRLEGRVDGLEPVVLEIAD